MDPKNLRYATTHEWASLEGDQCTLGITQFAVEQLTDIVFVELPEVGDHVFKGDSFGEIESVKAVSDLYSPIDGEVVTINEKLIEDPAKISSDPYLIPPLSTAARSSSTSIAIGHILGDWLPCTRDDDLL